MVAVLAITLHAVAASVRISVQDDAGKPLSGAVVYLESAAKGLSTIASAMLPAPGAGSSGVELVVLAGKPFQFVLVPVRAPLVVGWVLMGFPVTQQLGDEFHALVGVHLALLAGAAGAPQQIILSTLPLRYADALRGLSSADQEPPTDERLLLARRISVPTVGGTTHAVLLRSIDAMVAPYRSLQWVLGIITLAGALLFGIGMALMARRVTTPLRLLIAGTRQLGRGEYGQSIGLHRQARRSRRTGPFVRPDARLHLRAAVRGATSCVSRPAHRSAQPG